jgi:Flp pilus assembly protein TadB
LLKEKAVVLQSRINMASNTVYLIFMILIILALAGFLVYRLVESGRKEKNRNEKAAQDYAIPEIKKRLMDQGLDEVQAEAEAARRHATWVKATRRSPGRSYLAAGILFLVWGIVLVAVGNIWGLALALLGLVQTIWAAVEMRKKERT